MRSGDRSQLADVTVGVSDRPLRVTTRVYILATLRRFDNKLSLGPKTGPLIPCERRLANIGIWEFQELTFGARFRNRDYDRPY